MSVYITTFEIVGEGLELADYFDLKKQEARLAQWKFVSEVGGKGYLPDSWTGGLRSVLFDGDPPKGWRRNKRTHKGLIEAVPRKTTKIGKSLLDKIAALPRKPLATQLAAELGYNPESFAIHGTSIYFPTELRVTHPQIRHFLRLPLSPEDGFQADPAFLKAIPESELMKAVEDHNAEANRLREQEETQ